MSELKVYPVPESARKRALIDNGKYLELYKNRWMTLMLFGRAKALAVDEAFTPKLKIPPTITTMCRSSGMRDGELNACVNCLDRHLEKRGDQTALIYEGDDPNVSEHISYRKL